MPKVVKPPAAPLSSGKIDCSVVLEIAEELRKQGHMFKVTLAELDKRMARHLKRDKAA